MKTALLVVLTALLVLAVSGVAMFSIERARAAVRELEVAGTDIRTDIDDKAFQGGANPLIAWITRSAQIVAHYYDRFPTATLRVRVVPEDGGGVRSGKTFGYDGGIIR